MWTIVTVVQLANLQGIPQEVIFNDIGTYHPIYQVFLS